MKLSNNDMYKNKQKIIKLPFLRAINTFIIYFDKNKDTTFSSWKENNHQINSLILIDNVSNNNCLISSIQTKTSFKLFIPVRGRNLNRCEIFYNLLLISHWLP